MDPYDQQGLDFLNRFGIHFKATFLDTRRPSWDITHEACWGNHYTVTLSAPEREVSFDFWNGKLDADTPPTAYDVLAGLVPHIPRQRAFNQHCFNIGADPKSAEMLGVTMEALLERARESFGEQEHTQKRTLSFFTREEREALAEVR